MPFIEDKVLALDVWTKKEFVDEGKDFGGYDEEFGPVRVLQVQDFYLVVFYHYFHYKVDQVEKGNDYRLILEEDLILIQLNLANNIDHLLTTRHRYTLF